MNDNSPGGKISIIWSYFIYDKGNWSHLAVKKSQPRAKVTTTFKLSWKYFNRIIIKTFWKHLLSFGQQNHVRLFKVLF